MTEPRSEDRSTVFSLAMPDGSTRDVFVNPYGAEVLGSLNPDTTLSGYAVRLHGELMAGAWGERLIELAACWAIVMAITGYYLFWRGRRARIAAATVAARRGTRRSGLVAGVGLLFLLVSGLPWTGFWGEKAQTLATDQGHLVLEPRPRRDLRPGVDPGRVAAAQPRDRHPVGPG